MKILMPMAGLGRRFREVGYAMPKPLIDVCGKPMVQLVIESLNISEAKYVFVTPFFENSEHNKQLKSVLQQTVKDPWIISINKLTRGAVETCLMAGPLVDDEEPLVVINCDQVFQWDSQEFLRFIETTDADGVVAVYHSTHPKHSFIEIDENGNGTRLAEKIPISNLALNGLHYWKHGSDFVKYALQSFRGKATYNNEFYLSFVYNFMINDGKKIVPYYMTEEECVLIGTPDVLGEYVEEHMND